MSGKVGIVMPYFNDKDLLVKSVIGVLSQTYTNWELFLVDDGSAPGLRAKDILPKSISSKVRIIEKRNGGVSSARNTALDIIREEKKYDYIAYCDADDIWDENYLEQQLVVLHSEPNIDIVYSTFHLQMADGGPAFPYGITYYDEYPGLEFLLKSNFIYISSIVHRPKCLEVGNFDSNLNSIEDWDMWCRMAEAGYKFKRNKKTGITYTCKPNGMGSKSNASIFTAFYKKHGLFNNTNTQTAVPA